MPLRGSRAPGNPVITAISASAFASGTWALNYLVSRVDLPPHLAGGGHWQFLTNLSLLFTLVVLFIGVIAHITKSASLFNLKNNLHPIALVLECVVTTVYWPLKLFFLHLLVKDPTRKMIPLVVDLCLHLVPVVSLLVDYIFFMPKWTITNWTALATCLVLTTLYWVLLKQLVDFENGGEYPYMFLNVDNEATRMLIFQVVGLVGFASFLFFKKVYDLVVHPEVEKIEETKLKKNL
ncbi:CIC11C00000002158 [Sungouiella intermedia]|uniref:CIC11C00000002158 n=1 Tax=Sungouiella intermedia TaxID=45354 RepID=A0A1L0DDI2_9ASCO|nr:CIC11C00000002158 [[Candida] intermedia]